MRALIAGVVLLAESVQFVVLDDVGPVREDPAIALVLRGSCLGEGCM